MEEKITSRQNPLIRRFRRLQTDRRYREETGFYVGDSLKLLAEAVRFGPVPETVLVSEGTALPPLPDSVRVVTVPEDLMAYTSQMASPQGALFLGPIPPTPREAIRAGAVVLDGLQDPGNLGTVLRTADALGVPMAVLTEGCADLWHPRTLRASMGAVFRLPVITLAAEELPAACRQAGLRLLVSALAPGAASPAETDLTDSVMVIGSEGSGVRPALLAAAEGCVMIPMRERCESLNAAAAAAILIWEMRRGGAFSGEGETRC